MEQTVFGAGSVPVRVAAKVYGRDPSWVRAGIIEHVTKPTNYIVL